MLSLSYPIVHFLQGHPKNVHAKNDAYVTLKDHKDRFENNLQCHLINPSKPDMGCISKVLLDKIVRAVKQQTGVLLLKNTMAVID